MAPADQAVVDHVRELVREEARGAAGVDVVHDRTMRTPEGRMIEAETLPDGRIRINAAAFRDPARIRPAIREELAHRQIASAEGQELLDRFMREHPLGAQHIEALQRQGYRGNARAFHDEFIAKQAREQTPFWQDLVERVRTWLASKGVGTVTQEQAARAILRTLKRAKAGNGQSPQSAGLNRVTPEAGSRDAGLVTEKVTEPAADVNGRFSISPEKVDHYERNLGKFDDQERRVLEALPRLASADARFGKWTVGQRTAKRNLATWNQYLRTHPEERALLQGFRAEHADLADFVTPEGLLKGIPIEYRDGGKLIFHRSLPQLFLDRVNPEVWMRLQDKMVKATEDAYRKRTVEKLPVKIMGLDKESNLDRVKQEAEKFRVQSPVRYAEKTVAALNLNTACPEFVIGNRGCWMDACYLTQMANGNGTNLFERAMYTGEVLQMSEADVARMREIGGLRINGVGDTIDINTKPMQDIIRHAGERNLPIKIVTKQEATFKALQEAAAAGIKLDHVHVQPSIDYWWKPVADDLNQENSGARELVGGDQTRVAKLLSSKDARTGALLSEVYGKYGKEVKQIGGEWYRKDGFSWAQVEALREKYPDVPVIPRVVVGGVGEILDAAINHPDSVITLMHGKVNERIRSDFPGPVYNYGSARHWFHYDELREQAFVRGDKASPAEYGLRRPLVEKGGYQALEAAINKLTPAERKRVVENLERQTCCQANDSPDACADCASHCASRTVFNDPEEAQKLYPLNGGPAATGSPEQRMQVAAAVRSQGPARGPGGERYSLGEGKADNTGPVWRDNILESLSKWQNRGTAEQLRAHLAKTRGAMEQAEWIGLDDFLKDKPSVTKAEVEKFVRDNQVDLQEVVKKFTPNEDLQVSSEMKAILADPEWASGTPKTPKEWYELASALDYAQAGATFDHELKLSASMATLRDEALRHAREMDGAQEGAIPQFENYQLPGGRNYRELLLTLTEKDRDAELLDFNSRMIEKYGEGYGEEHLTAAERDQQDELIFRRQYSNAGNFVSPHWKEYNVLAHVRFNERTDADGKRVLFLEEVQSDWHQKGRREGYQGREAYPTTLPEGYEIRSREAANRQELQDEPRAVSLPWGVFRTRDGVLINAGRTPNDAIRRYYDDSGAGEPSRAVPDAPYKTTWPMLAMRRMIKWAADNGFDRIAWTPGAMQADRYDLSKQVSTLRYVKRDDGYLLKVFPVGRGAEWESLGWAVPESKLADYVGKEVADKIVKGEGVRDQFSGAMDLQGVDLKVGGEGMKKFYDEMLPAEVNRFAKKFGAKVGVTDIVKHYGVEESLNGGWDVVDPAKDPLSTTSIVKNFPDEAAATKYAEELSAGKEPVHAIDITPEMRQAAAGGMPKFSLADEYLPTEEERAAAGTQQRDWRVVQAEFDQAAEALRAAIKAVGDRRSPASRQEKYQAAARYRLLQDELRGNAGYVADLLTRHAKLSEELQGIKGKGEDARVAEIGRELENLQADLANVPGPMLNRVLAELQRTGKVAAAPEAAPVGRGLDDLVDWLRREKVDSPKRPLRERLMMGQKWADRANAAKDALSTAEAKLAGTWKAAVASFRRPPVDTPFRAAVKDWIFADSYTGLQTKRWVDEINRQIENPLRQQAISIWLDAKGDESLIRFQADSVPDRFAPAWKAALTLTAKEKELARRIKADFESKLEDAKTAGLLERGRMDYGVPQVWKVAPKPPTDQEQSILRKGQPGRPTAKLDPRNPFFSFERTYPTIYEGIMNEGVPEGLRISDLVAYYNTAFHKSLSSRAVIWRLKNEVASDGLPITKLSGSARRVTDEAGPGVLFIDSKGRDQADVTADGRPYRSLDHFALRDWRVRYKTPGGEAVMVRGDMLIHPDHYEWLKNELTQSPLREGAIGKVVNPILKSGAFLKASKLAFGTFHLATVGEHMVSHLANPFTNGFELDLRQPDQALLVRNGLELGTGGPRQMFEEGLAQGHGGLFSYVPGLGDAMSRFTNWMFQDYIPTISMKVGLEVLRRNRERYGKELSENQLAELTARQLNAAGGLLNYRLLGRSRTVMDLMRIGLLAPTFLEARAKVVGQALKPYNAEQRRMLMVQAAALYIGCRFLNARLDDDPHWKDNPFSVVHNGRAYSIRTIVGDAWHLFTDPASFASGRLSPWTRMGIEAVTQRDLRTGARKEPPIQTEWVPGRVAQNLVMDLAKWLLPVGSEGLMPGAAAREQTPLSTVGSMFGVGSRKFTAGQQMYNLASSWNRAQPDARTQSFQMMRDAAVKGEGPYRKLDNLLNAGRLADAQQEYQSLLKEGHTADAIKQRYDNVDRPFTGMVKREDLFQRTLTPKQREIYAKAIAERKALRETFRRLAR